MNMVMAIFTTALVIIVISASAKSKEDARVMHGSYEQQEWIRANSDSLWKVFDINSADTNSLER